MADNSSSANGNSWTILTPEVKESGVESVGPLDEGLEGPSHTDPEQSRADQQDPKDLSQRSDITDGPADHNIAHESPQVAPLETNEDEAVLHATHEKDSTLGAPPVENITCSSSDPEQQGISAGHPESEPLISPDADSFSDSYTHISPSQESTLQPAVSQEEEGFSAEEEKSELRKTLREDVEVFDEQESEGDGLRRRKVSQLSPIDHRDEEEEEEGEDEPYRPPQRDDVGFSLNKCIFGAVILLGLGTIFFSGVLLDLDEEGDADLQELKNQQIQKDWLNLEASSDAPAGVQPPDALERLAKESQKIAVLQAQLQEKKGELKAVQMQVEEGTQERLKREEIEVEIQRMRGELDKLPVLQKELEQESERAKKDMEALPTMQKELEFLKARVTELAQSTGGAPAVTPLTDSVTPSAGHENEMPGGQPKKEKKDKKLQEKVRKEKEGKEGKKGREEGKPWKDQGSEGKEPKKEKERENKAHQDEGRRELRVKGERKVWKDEKEEKKGKKQEDGKRWKDAEVKRESREEFKKRERKEDDQRWKDGKVKREFSEDGGKEDKKWKKEKPWQLDGGRWETKERKHSKDKAEDGKEGNLRGDPKDGKDERDWKRGRQAGSNGKERKEKGEKKKERNEWDSEKERSPKGEGKAHKKDSWKGQKDHHGGNDGKKEWKERTDKRSNWKEKESPKNERKAEDGTRKSKGDDEKNGDKWSKKDKQRKSSSDKTSHHSYSDRKKSQDHAHDDYWTEQRERIRHYHGSTEGCDGVPACAHAEGLTPVSQHDFEALLSAFLAKLVAPGNQASKKEELNKLISEFFANGVFIHDQIPFSEFVEDVSDILEDMAEGEEDEDEEVEDEMEKFAREAMEKFALSGRGGSEDKRKESGRKRASG